MIEVDITSPSLDKFPLYARLGVPEVWRYDGEKLTIFGIRDDGYAELAGSVSLSPLTGAVLTRFVEESRSVGSVDWTRRVREWARERIG